MDYRIPGIFFSAVQEQDEQKRQTVATLIEKFESQQYKNQLLQVMSQTQKINRLSEASQKLLEDMTALLLQKLGSFLADADEI